jgi:hypothetical protein
MSLEDEDLHAVSVDQPDGSVALAGEHSGIFELRDVRRDRGSPDCEACVHLGGELCRGQVIGNQQLLDDRALDRIAQLNERPAYCIVWQFGNG